MDPSASGIQSCRSVSVGADFDVAIVVEDVADLIAFQLYFLYDPALVNVVGLNVNLFLASPPGASVFDLSDDLPDSDGDHLVAAINFGPAPGATGSGVLARLTLSAVGSGGGPLTLGSGVIELELADSESAVIDIGSITNGYVAVGQPCP
jgi:hypothetical protein